MSSERGEGNKSSSRPDEGTGESSEGTAQLKQPSRTKDSGPPQKTPPSTTTSVDSKWQHAAESGSDTERKPAARPLSTPQGEEALGRSQVTLASAQESAERPRQVIAVSANRGPTAFFNLAKRFLITDEICDLSALEGAIVAAVDAAHLLERSKLATIVRVQTSYVAVEPKRKKRESPPVAVGGSGTELRSGNVAASISSVAHAPPSLSAYPPPAQHQASTHDRRPSRQRGGRGSPGAKRGERELKRARIVITVRRTPAYKQWLDENPLQAVIAHGGDDEDRPTDTQAEERLFDSKPA